MRQVTWAEHENIHISLLDNYHIVKQLEMSDLVGRPRDSSGTFPIECPIAAIEDIDERTWQLRIFCTPLLLAVEHKFEHFQRLDQQLCQLLLDRSSTSASEQPMLPFDRTPGLIARLPPTPQRRFTLPLNNGMRRSKGSTLWDSIMDGRWSDRYIVPSARTIFKLRLEDDAESALSLLERMQDTAWENLYVTQLVDTNTKRLAAAFENQSRHPDLELARLSYAYVNLLAELIDEYQSISDAAAFGIQDPFPDLSEDSFALKRALFPEEGNDSHQARAVLRVFLWTVWQRSVMLHFHYIVGVQLQQGYSSEWNALLAVNGVHDLSGVLEDSIRGTGAAYICNWAFQILRTSRTSVGLDFRHMINKFDNHFQGKDGRCMSGSKASCTGGDPGSCQRFTAAGTAPQSAHVLDCDKNCTKIIWNPDSYLSCAKPAATVADPASSQLYYGQVSTKTLAISHVWSHGQGGRPETGINTCLHNRYCALAKQFGFDTYWIDSACIPSEQNLRRAAIDQINQVFATAGAALVVDADIQDVGISKEEIGIDEIETIVSILLVCDWNVRGWTMLEGIRGSRSIFLLCRGDYIVSLREILIRLHQEGAIDLAALLGCAQHLIPHADPSTSKSVEEAGFLLSHRHTSWPEDIIICWSLLMNIPPIRNAAEIWTAQSRVRTAFLLSSSPRVQNRPGLGWAPNTPYVRPIERIVEPEGGREQQYTVCFPPYDGSGSLYAAITPEGLQGQWRIIEVDRSLLEATEEDCCYKYPESGYEHPDEASAWLLMQSLRQQGAQIRLLRALAEDGISAYSGSSQRGETFGLLAAICASFDSGKAWQWQGVYRWQDDDNSEKWEIAEMLLV